MDKELYEKCKILARLLIEAVPGGLSEEEVLEDLAPPDRPPISEDDVLTIHNLLQSTNTVEEFIRMVP